MWPTHSTLNLDSANSERNPNETLFESAGTSASLKIKNSDTNKGNKGEKNKGKNSTFTASMTMGSHDTIRHVDSSDINTLQQSFETPEVVQVQRHLSTSTSHTAFTTPLPYTFSEPSSTTTTPKFSLSQIWNRHKSKFSNSSLAVLPSGSNCNVEAHNGETEIEEHAVTDSLAGVQSPPMNRPVSASIPGQGSGNEPLTTLVESPEEHLLLEDKCQQKDVDGFDSKDTDGDTNMRDSAVSPTVTQTRSSLFRSARRGRPLRHSSLILTPCTTSTSTASVSTPTSNGTRKKALASTSAPRSSSSAPASAPVSTSTLSSVLRPRPDEDGDHDAGYSPRSNASKVAASPQQAAIADAQKRIVLGREQLEHYTLEIQKMQTERFELMEAQAQRRQVRGEYEDDIEGLEKSLRELNIHQEGQDQDCMGGQKPRCFCAETTATVALGNLSMTEIGQTAVAARFRYSGSSGSRSGITSLMELSRMGPAYSPSETKVSLPPGLDGNNRDVSAGMNATTTPPSSASTLAPSSSPSSLMCSLCRSRVVLLAKRELVSKLAGEMEKVQQKANSLGSQIKQMQRTYIVPIERYLAEDRDAWTQLQEQKEGRR